MERWQDNFKLVDQEHFMNFFLDKILETYKVNINDRVEYLKVDRKALL